MSRSMSKLKLFGATTNDRRQRRAYRQALKERGQHGVRHSLHRRLDFTTAHFGATWSASIWAIGELTMLVWKLGKSRSPDTRYIYIYIYLFSAKAKTNRQDVSYIQHKPTELCTSQQPTKACSARSTASRQRTAPSWSPADSARWRGSQVAPEPRLPRKSSRPGDLRKAPYQSVFQLVISRRSGPAPPYLE